MMYLIPFKSTQMRALIIAMHVNTAREAQWILHKPCVMIRVKDSAPNQSERSEHRRRSALGEAGHHTSRSEHLLAARLWAHDTKPITSLGWSDVSGEFKGLPACAQTQVEDRVVQCGVSYQREKHPEHLLSLSLYVKLQINQSIKWISWSH